MPRPVQDEDYVPERLYPIKQSAPPTTVQDESKPRSTPLSESDVYIRKRLILADVGHCEREALDSLQIGSVLAFTVSKDNGTVTVTHRSDRVGYIGKQDALPFAAGLQLGRRIYGIITSIDRTARPEKYELEAWFDGRIP